MTWRRFEVSLVDDAAQVHGHHCGHCLREHGHQTFDVTVDVDPDLGEYVEDLPATVRDMVTARVHKLRAGTSDADCDVDYFACSGLVSTDPPQVAL